MSQQCEFSAFISHCGFCDACHAEGRRQILTAGDAMHPLGIHTQAPLPLPFEWSEPTISTFGLMRERLHSSEHLRDLYLELKEHGTVARSDYTYHTTTIILRLKSEWGSAVATRKIQRCEYGASCKRGCPI